MTIETKNKTCVDCKEEFTIDSGDLDLYEKIGLMIPEKCFFCRQKQYFAFFPFGKFRKGKSDLSGENLITVLPEKSRYPIYNSHEWWGDGWDPMIHGQNYNPDKLFFDQLKELQEKIPRPHQVGKNNTNCDWCDDTWDCKNCYLSRSQKDCENLYYSYRNVKVKDSFDIVYSFNLQNCYDCLGCHNSFNLNFSENSRDCVDSYFLFDCRNSQNCFMSWNLRNKQYCIRNKQYTKEEYENELKKIKFDSHQNIQDLKEEFEAILKEQAVHRENFNIRTTSSTGNFLIDCDKCTNCFSWEYSQNCRNSLRGLYTKDCIDQAVSWYDELSGNNACVYGGYQINNSAWSNAKYSEYLDLCDDVEYCFGCIGLRKKKYCILNKQYSKEDYEKLKTQIISDMRRRGEYGKFLPYSMGLCGYNLSNGMVYFPHVSKEEMAAKGGYWSEENLSQTDGVPVSQLPDSINDTPAEISSQAFICPETHYRFNIAPSEYQFHKRKNFALPRLHFDQRILKRMGKLAVLKSYPYKCLYCEKDINAYYLPDWGYQKIACEECYKQNIA